MSVKTDAELTSLNNSRLPDNSVRFISAEKVRSQIKDLIDSKVSVKGGNVVEAELGYSTAITPSTDYSFATKKYVDDVAAGIDLSNYYTKSETDAFFDAQDAIINTKIGLSDISGTNGVSYNSGTGVFSIDATKVPYFTGGISGTPSGSTYLRGDGVWATVGSGFDPAVSTLSALNLLNLPILSTDTINVFAGKTQGQINATKNKVGVLFSDDFSTNTIANYTQVGAASFSISGGRMTVSGGTNVTSNLAYYNLCKVNSDNVTFKITQTIGELNKTGIKYKIGATQYLIFGLNTSVSASSFIETEMFPVISLSNGGSSGNTGLMDCQLNDIIDGNLTINGFDAVITYYNRRSGVSITTAISNFNYNTGFFNIISMEGTNYIDSFSVIDNHEAAINRIVIGDSITRGSNGGLISIEDTWIYRVQQAIPGVIKLAGGSDQIDTSAAYLAMVANYDENAEIDLFIGANNLNNLPTMQTNYAALVTALQTAGRIVNIFTLLDYGSQLANTATFNAWLKSTYSGTNRIIDINKVLNTQSSSFSTDLVHPNVAGSMVLANFIINYIADNYDYKINYSYLRNRRVRSQPIEIQDPSEGAPIVGPNALLVGDTSITLTGKTGFKNSGYAIVYENLTENREVIYYGGSTDTQLTNIKRGMMGTTAIAIPSGSVRVMAISQYTLGATNITAPRFLQAAGDLFAFNCVPFNPPLTAFSVELGARRAEFRSTTGTMDIYLTKSSATSQSTLYFRYVGGGTQQLISHTTDNFLCLGNFSTGMFMDSGQNVIMGSKDPLYRLTNGGSNVTGRWVMNASRSLTTGKSIASSTTNPLAFLVGNGTRFIAVAGFDTVNVVTTAGAEVGELGIYTKDAGAAMALRATIGANGISTTFGFALGYVAKTSTYTILNSDYTIDCTSGTFTTTLPTAVGIAGKIFVVKNSGAGVITIATTSSQTIDGFTTKVLNTQYAGVKLQSTGANWAIIGAF